MEKVPSRIPICPSAGHFPVEYAGISWYEAMYDYDKLAQAGKKYHEDFPPDFYCGPRIHPRKKEAMENLARYIIRASFSQE